jgi:hypothetical protein
MIWERTNRFFYNKIFFIFLLGFTLRLYACMNTPIVNPDGVEYIHQARAIYYGEWRFTSYCTLDYLSNYPFFIAGAYTIFHNWIMAARSISFLFGCAALVPLYLMLRKFFDDNISALCTLIFAVIPVFVSRSGDVVRGPVCWFFLTLGLFFFVSQIKDRNRIYLMLSNLSFLMATWARVEVVLFIIVSCLYIIFAEEEARFLRLAIFLSPVITIALLYLAWTVFSGMSDSYRGREILEKLSGTIDQYRGLRAELKGLAAQHRDTVMGYFLPNARSLIWLIALGTLLRRFMQAFFHPFFLVFLIGVPGVWRRIKADRSILYFALLSISGLVLLYTHIIHMWILTYRFMAVVILPGCIFVGFGLEKILHFMQRRFDLKKSFAVVILGLLILFSTLPKNLKLRESDKAVFRQIGEMIGEREGNDRVITVTAEPSTVHKWVSFYANLKYSGVFCARDSGLIGEDYGQLVTHFRQNGLKYLLWEENRWPVEKIDFIHTQYHQDFKELGSWHHPDTGRLILFELRSPRPETV